MVVFPSDYPGNKLVQLMALCRYTVVSRRRVGKSSCLVPVGNIKSHMTWTNEHAEICIAQEQFTDDWNHLTNAPIAEGEPTAGNYDWWTNLYGIGLVSPLRLFTHPCYTRSNVVPDHVAAHHSDKDGDAPTAYAFALVRLARGAGGRF